MAINFEEKLHNEKIIKPNEDQQKYLEEIERNINEYEKELNGNNESYFLSEEDLKRFINYLPNGKSAEFSDVTNELLNMSIKQQFDKHIIDGVELNETQQLSKKSVIKEIFENIDCEEKCYLSMAIEKEIKDTLEKNNTAISNSIRVCLDNI
ncbi:unnamed protein product [Brachionus calyciflorus]|uniref:Uncharacterized protein n=1 Tax=Brachionus calyciflorus TaxID=104777 RepID=A0A814EI62_9BILA|nr:unnamed protein product [Brachionus calyciflorus]